MPGPNNAGSTQTGQIGGFRDVPVDFKAGNQGNDKKNKNKNKGGNSDGGGKKK